MSPKPSFSPAMKYISRLLAVVVVLIGCLYSLFQISKSRTFQFFGEIIPRVETDKKVVALTFDDAPTQHSEEVLALLTEKKVVATFYAIGQNLARYPQVGQHIVQAGHELGNHSYSHQRMLLTSPTVVAAELEQTNRLIREAGYQGEITFRPPYGKKLLTLPWYLSQHQIKTIMVDVEPETYMPQLDTEAEQTEFMVNHTLEKTRAGSIILLHPFCDSCGPARASLAPIIDGLRAKGYEFVTVAELLKLK